MSNIHIDELSAEIAKALTEYSEEVVEIVNKAVDVTAEEVNEEIKSHCTFGGSGSYIKSFKLKTIEKAKYKKIKTWHADKHYYRLTHLLERGHATQKGGRTRDFPHIKYGEEIAEKNLEKRITEGINAIK